MAGLAGDLEGNTVGGGILELKGAGGKVVEILAKELLGRNVSRLFALCPSLAVSLYRSRKC